MYDVFVERRRRSIPSNSRAVLYNGGATSTMIISIFNMDNIIGDFLDHYDSRLKKLYLVMITVPEAVWWTHNHGILKRVMVL
uniref:Uncharacterized protein n=1 Tax=Romanomermis culicivorax TaxID=13658 RepID=A0A915IP84_ROMCU